MNLHPTERVTISNADGPVLVKILSLGSGFKSASYLITGQGNNRADLICLVIRPSTKVSAVHVVNSLLGNAAGAKIYIDASYNVYLKIEVEWSSYFISQIEGSSANGLIAEKQTDYDLSTLTQVSF